jgi:hypothetical protein
MRNLMIAIVIVLTSAVTAAFVLTRVGVPSTVAQTVATAMFGLVPSLKEAAERWRLKSKPSSERALALTGFELNNWKLFSYCVLLAFGSLQVASGIGGLAAGLSGTDEAGAVRSMAVLAILVGMPLIYLSGRWIGRRSGGGGWWLVILAVIVTRVVATALDLIFLPKTFLATMANELGDGSYGPTYIIKQIGFGALLMSAISVLGYWRGRRQHLSEYLAQLLKRIAPEARTAIIELAYEEARRVADQASSPSTSVSPLGASN